MGETKRCPAEFSPEAQSNAKPEATHPGRIGAAQVLREKRVSDRLAALGAKPVRRQTADVVPAMPARHVATNRPRGVEE
jgi:hypothetical protein